MSISIAARVSWLCSCDDIAARTGARARLSPAPRTTHAPHTNTFSDADVIIAFNRFAFGTAMIECYMTFKLIAAQKICCIPRLHNR